MIVPNAVISAVLIGHKWILKHDDADNS